MTTIRLLGRQGIQLGFEISGHTGAGSEGNDLVCAAVSFLATTCVNALESVAKAPCRVLQDEAYLRADIPENDLNLEAVTILKTFRQGAMDLRQAYPRYMKLIDETI